MPYDVNHVVTTGELKYVAQIFKGESDKALKSLSVTGRTINFYTSDDASGTAAATIDLPKDLFLDQLHTTFVQKFTFNAATYEGATNPNLDGKPVFVLAVKGSKDPANGAADDTISYSFIDVSSLVDTYTTAAGVSSQVLTISGYTVSFNISSTAGNILRADENGLYATNRLSSFTPGNIVVSDSNGATQDGDILAEDIITTADRATHTELEAMLTGVGFTLPVSNG